MCTRAKKWCSQDIKIVTMLYYMGAKEQEISHLLKRTPQSINKKITRLGLRIKNSETHVITPNRLFSKDVTLDDISAYLKKTYDQLKNHKDLKAALLKLYPLKKTKKVSLKSKKSTEFLGLEKEKGQWRSLKEIAHFLQKRHYTIAPLKEIDYQRTGFSHCLNGAPKRPVDLLIKVNKLQHAQGKPPFYLEDYTEE